MAKLRKAKDPMLMLHPTIRQALTDFELATTTKAIVGSPDPNSVANLDASSAKDKLIAVILRLQRLSSKPRNPSKSQVSE
jgi:hypothetical protein